MKSNLKFVISIGVIAGVSYTAFAASTTARSSFCTLEDPGVIRKIVTPDQPNYFFRPLQNSDRVSFSDGSKNYILDLKTGVATQIPGAFDPVPTQDERLMTTPHVIKVEGGRSADAVEFYEMADVYKPDAKPIFTDNTMKGTYQSLGTLSSNSDGTQKKIRMLDTGGEFLIRDYAIDESNPQKTKITPLGTQSSAVCDGKNLSLPMLSKDGKQISALDNDAHETRVYNIDPETGICELAYSLHAATGKVDFSPDGESLLFSVSNHDPHSDSKAYVNVPSDRYVANIYLKNLQTGAVSKLTNHTDGNSLFPAFQKQSVVYLTYPPGSDKDAKIPAYFIVANPALAPNSNVFSDKQTCKDCGLPGTPSASSSAVALGGLWAQVCTRYSSQLDASTAALLTISMSREKCRELVESQWANQKALLGKNKRLMSSGHLGDGAIDRLSENDLMNACPAEKSGSVENVQATGLSSRTLAKLDPRVPTTCQHCHGNQFPFGDRAALQKAETADGKPLIAEMIRRIKSKSASERMPMDMPALTDDQAERFIDFLTGN